MNKTEDGRNTTCFCFERDLESHDDLYSVKWSRKVARKRTDAFDLKNVKLVNVVGELEQRTRTILVPNEGTRKNRIQR